MSRKTEKPEALDDDALDGAQGGGLLLPAVQDARLAVRRATCEAPITDGTSNTFTAATKTAAGDGSV